MKTSPFLLALVCCCLTPAWGQAVDWSVISEHAEKVMDSGHYAAAIPLYDKAISLKPDHPSLYANRGNCYSMSDNLEQALKDYDKAIELALLRTEGKEDKRFAYFYYNKAYAYERQDMHREAISIYEKAIAIDPETPDAKAYLAWVLATSYDAALRDPKRAVEIARKECEGSGWKDSDLVDTLAAALAANGQFDEAVKWQLKAIDLEKSKEGIEEFTERLKLYREKRPYVQERQAAAESVGQ